VLWTSIKEVSNIRVRFFEETFSYPGGKWRHQVSPASSRPLRRAAEVLCELKTGVEASPKRRLSDVWKNAPNVVAHEHRFTRLRLFVKACLNPLVILLLVLAIISFATARAHPTASPAC